jgi:hypothetical protein
VGGALRKLYFASVTLFIGSGYHELAGRHKRQIVACADALLLPIVNRLQLETVLAFSMEKHRELLINPL